MVRFLWHVEDGHSAHLPPGAFSLHKDNSVRHAACEIEVPNSKESLEAIFTLPANYLDIDKIRETGIVLGHGSNASEWKGKLLTEISVFLASQGYVVIRYCCKQKEQRRQRMYEKALDACATSPFARGISRWVLAGFGSGARVAAVVGTRCRGSIAGFVLMSYPLKEAVPPPTKARKTDEELPSPPKTSEGPLLTLEQPILFLLGDSDDFCSPTDLRELTQQMSSSDIRVELFEDATQEFKTSSQSRGPAISVVRRLCNCVLDFVTALDEGTLPACKLGKPQDTLPNAQGTDKASGAVEPAPPIENGHQPAAPMPSQPQMAAPAVSLASSQAQAGTAMQAPQQAPQQVPQQALPPSSYMQQPGTTQLPQLFQQISQQMMGAQMLQNPAQAQQLLQMLQSNQQALAGQRPHIQPQALQQPFAGFWAQPQPQQQQQQRASQAATPSLHQILMQHIPPQHRAPSPTTVFQQQHLPGTSQEAAAAGVPQAFGQRPAPTGAQMLHAAPMQSIAQAPPQLDYSSGLAPAAANELQTEPEEDKPAAVLPNQVT